MLRVVQVVRQQECNGHCLCDCPSTAVETAIAQCTSRWAMAKGHCLNTSIVLAAVHGLSGLFRAESAVEPSLFRPLPPLSPSLISHLASVDLKQHRKRTVPLRRQLGVKQIQQANESISGGEVEKSKARASSFLRAGTKIPLRTLPVTHD